MSGMLYRGRWFNNGSGHYCVTNVWQVIQHLVLLSPSSYVVWCRSKNLRDSGKLWIFLVDIQIKITERCVAAYLQKMPLG